MFVGRLASQLSTSVPVGLCRRSNIGISACRRIDHAGDMAGAGQHVFHRAAEILRAGQHRFRRRDVVLARREIVDRHLDLAQVEL